MQKDRVGQICGNLLIIEPSHNPNPREDGKKDRHTFWLCKCNCGNTIIVASSDLQYELIKSCGCTESNPIKIKTETNRYVDLLDKKFGHLLVIEYGYYDKKKELTFWLCRCDCGTEKYISATNLRRSNHGTKTCGKCIYNKGNTKGTIKDLVGQRFGRLLVIEDSGERQQRRVLWKCLCDCGKEKIINAASLLSGKTTSCGCWHKEVTKTDEFIKSHQIQYNESAFNSLYCAYQKRAEKRKLEFSLSKDIFKLLINQKCFYCGRIPLQTRKNTSNNGDCIYNGIDRIDSSKGYVVENVVTCCKICNYSKRSMSIDEFYTFINEIYKNFGKQSLEEMHSNLENILQITLDKN